MGRTACTEPQCLYKGDLYLLPLLYLITYQFVCYALTALTVAQGKRRRVEGFGEHLSGNCAEGSSCDVISGAFPALSFHL